MCPRCKILHATFINANALFQNNDLIFAEWKVCRAKSHTIDCMCLVAISINMRTTADHSGNLRSTVEIIK